MPALNATAVIAEDEPVLRRELVLRLAHLWPTLRILGEAENGMEAVALLDREAPDILFLDIEMPGMSGLEVARHANGRSHIVFVTAFDAHAVAAFDQGAVDYVLKPYDDARLGLALQRLQQRLGSAPVLSEGVLRELARLAPKRDYLRWVNAAVGTEVQLITVDEVCYFQADSRYTRVVTAQREPLIRLAMKELLETLDPACFWQIHRSTIVNANAIAGVTRDLRGHMKLKLKQRPEKLAVSVAHERLFRQM
jgi:DNA-binding LytR/AlgR family response regulator